MVQGQTGPAPETSVLDDFELVRNGQGHWLLVLPGFPEKKNDSPVIHHAELVEDELILSSDDDRILLQSLIAPHYAATLRTDKPAVLLLCVVNEEGINRFVAELPFHC
jgi:hypothetical protein